MRADPAERHRSTPLPQNCHAVGTALPRPRSTLLVSSTAATPAADTRSQLWSTTIEAITRPVLASEHPIPPAAPPQSRRRPVAIWVPRGRNRRRRRGVDDRRHRKRLQRRRSPGPVFTEHARLHVVDGSDPAHEPGVHRARSLHGVDEDAPVRNPSLMRFPKS